MTSQSSQRPFLKTLLSRRGVGAMQTLGQGWHHWSPCFVLQWNRRIKPLFPWFSLSKCIKAMWSCFLTWFWFGKHQGEVREVAGGKKEGRRGHREEWGQKNRKKNIQIDDAPRWGTRRKYSTRKNGLGDIWRHFGRHDKHVVEVVEPFCQVSLLLFAREVWADCSEIEGLGNYICDFWSLRVGKPRRKTSTKHWRKKCLDKVSSSTLFLPRWRALRMALPLYPALADPKLGKGTEHTEAQSTSARSVPPLPKFKLKDRKKNTTPKTYWNRRDISV